MMYLVSRAGLAPTPADEFGGMQLPNDSVIKRWFNHKGSAEAYAKELAGKKPGTMFTVLAVDTIYEAQVPKIMEKKVTETGEVVPK